MTETKVRLSAEEFIELVAHDERKLELVGGEVVEVVRPGPLHGRRLTRLNVLLEPAASEAGGWLASDVGCRVARDPDQIRGPDLLYMSPERLPPDWRERSFLEGAPDLAIEVVSPGDTMADLQAKVREYLAAGSRLVWLVEPRSRTVTVYRPDGSATLLGEDDTLTGEDVLPGLRLPVRQIFQD